MKIYQVKSPDDMDVLLAELEKRGLSTYGGDRPTSVGSSGSNLWNINRDTSCIVILSSFIFTYSSLSSVKIHYPDVEVAVYTPSTDIDVKLYYVEVSGDYDDLMMELSREGCVWRDTKRPPVDTLVFDVNKSDTFLIVSDNQISKTSLSECLIKYLGVDINKHIYGGSSSRFMERGGKL